MSDLPDEKIKELLQNMPPKHRLAVETCIMASKVKKSQNRKYKYDWLYECMLL